MAAGELSALLQALASAGSEGESAEATLAKLQAQARGLLAASKGTESDVRKAEEAAVAAPAEAGSDGSAPVPSPEQGNVEQQGGIDVAVLQASPLVMLRGGSAGTGQAANSAAPPVQAVPVAPLELATERRLILKSIRDSTRALRVAVLPATADTLQHTWVQGTRVLHFSGHGGRDAQGVQYIVLEGADGSAQMLTLPQLHSILRCRPGSAVQVVFVSACQSVVVGQAFLSCGAQYVIAVGRGSKVLDASSLLFARGFYHALFTGHSVPTAFQIATSRVDVEKGRGEAEKFVLLAQESSILGARPRPEALPPFPPATTPAGSLADCSGHAPSFMWLPAPPDILVGRRREIYHIVRLLTQGACRLVTVRGFPGIGKTTAVVSVAHFLLQRSHIMEAVADGVVVVALRGVDSAVGLVQRLGRALTQGQRYARRHGAGQAEGGPTGAEEDGPPPSTSTSPSRSTAVPEDAPAAFHLPAWGTVLGLLGGEGGGCTPPRVCLVLDNLEDALNEDAGATRLVLGSLLGACPGVCLLATSRRAVVGDGLLSTLWGNPSHARESVVSLKALHATEAAELLARRSPRSLTAGEIWGGEGGGEGSEATPPATPPVGDPRSSRKQRALSALGRHPVLKYLNGHPHAISLAAALLLDRSLSDVAHFLHTRGAMALTPHSMPHMLGGLSGDGTPLPQPPGAEASPHLSLAGSLRASVTALARQHPQALVLLLLMGLYPRGLHDGDFLWIVEALPFAGALGELAPRPDTAAAGSAAASGGAGGAHLPTRAPDVTDAVSVASGSSMASDRTGLSHATSVGSTGSALTSLSIFSSATPPPGGIMGGGGPTSTTPPPGGKPTPLRGSRGGLMLHGGGSMSAVVRPRALAAGSAPGAGMPWWAQDNVNPWGSTSRHHRVKRRRVKAVSRAAGRAGPGVGGGRGWVGMRQLGAGGEGGGVRPRASVHVLSAVTESLLEGGPAGAAALEGGGDTAPARGGPAPGVNRLASLSPPDMHRAESGGGLQAMPPPLPSPPGVDWRGMADVLVQWSVLERRGVASHPAAAATTPAGSAADDAPLAMAILHAWLTLAQLGGPASAPPPMSGSSPPAEGNEGLFSAVVGEEEGGRGGAAPSVASSRHSALSFLSWGGGSSLFTFSTQGGGGGGELRLPGPPPAPSPGGGGEPLDAAGILAWAASPHSVAVDTAPAHLQAVATNLRAASKVSLRWYSTFPYVVEYARGSLAPPLTSLLGGVAVDTPLPLSSLVPPTTRMLRVPSTAGGRGGSSPPPPPLTLTADTASVATSRAEGGAGSPPAGAPVTPPPSTRPTSAFSSPSVESLPPRGAAAPPLLSRESSGGARWGGMGKGKRGAEDAEGGPTSFVSRIPRPRMSVVGGALRGVGKGGALGPHRRPGAGGRSAPGTPGRRPIASSTPPSAGTGGGGAGSGPRHPPSPGRHSAQRAAARRDSSGSGPTARPSLAPGSTASTRSRTGGGSGSARPPAAPPVSPGTAEAPERPPSASKPAALDPRPPPSVYAAFTTLAKARQRTTITPAGVPSALSRPQCLRAALLLRATLHWRAVSQFCFAFIDSAAGSAASAAAFLVTDTYWPSMHSHLLHARRELLAVCALDEASRNGGSLQFREGGGLALVTPQGVDASAAGTPALTPLLDTTCSTADEGDSDSEGDDGHASPAMPAVGRAHFLPSAFVLACKHALKQCVLMAASMAGALLLHGRHEAALQAANLGLSLCTSPTEKFKGAASATDASPPPAPAGPPAYGIRFRFGAACCHKALGIALSFAGNGTGSAAKGRMSSAKMHLAAARSLFRGAGSRHGEALAWAALAEVHAKVQNLHGARRCLNSALNILQATGLIEAEVEVTAQLASLCARLGDKEEASHLHATQRRLRGRVHERRVRLTTGREGPSPRTRLLRVVASTACIDFAAKQAATAARIQSSATEAGVVPARLVNTLHYSAQPSGTGHLQDLPLDYCPAFDEVPAFSPRLTVPDLTALALEMPLQPPTVRHTGVHQ